MAEETLLIAKAVLRNRKGRQNIQQSIFLSDSTITACSRAAQHLSHMSINTEEKELLAQAKTIEDVEEIISCYVQEVEKKRSSSKTWKKVYAFSKFAGPLLDIFKQANFSPECSLALGLPLNNKSEIEDRLEFEVNQLNDVLSQVKFTNTIIKTPEMDIEIQGLCATMVDFLVHALRYQKKWSIVKIMGSIIADFTKRFQSFVTKIKGHASRIEALAQRGYSTVLIQSKEILDATSRVLYELQSHISAQTALTSIAISRLQEDLLLCRESINSQSRVEAIKYIHQLSKALLPASYDIPDAKIFIRKQELALSPRERWENHVSEIQAPGWRGRDPRPMLWIGGRQNHRGVSWVSSFSVDFVQALELEQGINIAYVFCNTGIPDEKQKPILVLKKMTLKLLKTYPGILSLPANLENLSVERFEQVGESSEQVFRILSDILKMIDEHCHQKQTETFILIDRVDVCLSRENLQGRQRFLRALQQLNTAYKTLRIILTSQYPVKEVSFALEPRDAMTEIWVDTTKPIVMHSRH